MMFRGIVASMLAAQAASETLNGHYMGSVPFIIQVDATFDGSDKADVDVNVKVASTRITCPGESISETDSEVTFPNAVNDGDCLGDGIRSDGKDVTKYVIEKTAAGLTYKSDGYPDLKMTKQSLGLGDTCSLYEIADGECGQSDLNCDYVKYAKAAEKALQDGTCADQGYTVQTGTQTKSYPVIGDIVITTYSKGFASSPTDDQPLGIGIPKVFIEGFLQGFVGDATHVKSCVGASEKVVQDAGKMLGHLKARQFVKAISDIQALVSDGMDDLAACKGLLADFAPILAALKSPHFKENFLAHDREILDLMEDELEVCTFGAPDGKKCGKDLGKQVRSIVIGDKLSNNLQTLPAEVFLVGFLEGFIGSSKHIKACVGQSMKVATDAGHLVGDLKSRNLNKTFTDLQSLVTDAMGEPAACKDLSKDLAPFMAAFKKPNFKENFLAHDKEILDRLEDMMDVCTFGAPDGHKCGVDAGKEVRSIVIGDSIVV